MAKTKILLLEPVSNLGDEGQSVEVKAGYFRNFLGPKGKAIPLTQGNRKQIEALQARRQERKAKELGGAQAIAAQIEALRLVIRVKTGDQGRMYGAVTAAELSKALESESAIHIDRKDIALHTPIKALGQHTTKIRLHPEVSAQLQFEIVSENAVVEV